MNSRLILSLACLCLLFSIQAQNKKYLDSLNQVSKSYVCIDNATYDSLSREVINKAEEAGLSETLGEALIIKGYSFTCAGKLENAIKTFGEALALFEEINSASGKAKVYQHTLSAFLRLSKIDTARYLARLQKRFAEESADTLLVANYYLNMSSIHTMVAQNDSIIYYALRGLEILGDLDNDKLRGSFNIAMGNSCYNNEDFPQAIKYHSRAKQYFSEESMNMGRIYHNLGCAFTKLEAYDSSNYYFKKTIAINERLDRKLFLAYNYQGLAQNYGQSGDCTNAIKYNLLALEKSRELGEIRSRSGVHANISECYVLTGQLEKAVENAREAVRLTKLNGDADKEADAYFLLSEAYKAQGRYKEAFEAHKKFYSLDSMLLGRDRQATIASMEAAYDLERKEAKIASLSQQASIQALEIQQKNQALIMILIVSLFVGASVYFVYKQREARKLQTQTELEQRFLRSQLNPHFISNALVAVQSFMLKNDSKSAARYLTKFSKLMREILENSRREFIPVEEEINMLKDYIDIHQQRLGTFEYSIELDEEIDPEMDTIPPMFIQPFVENAVEHGIGKMQEGGRIDLKFKKDGDFITVAVNDNGKGLFKNNTTTHRSLSTTIIRERMELFNRTLKKKIQLVVDNLRNENGDVSGTKVELKVPFGI